MAYFSALSPSGVSDSSSSSYKYPDRAQCGCGGAVEISDTCGLSMLPNALEAPLHVVQGQDLRTSLCFTRGCLSVPVSSLTAGAGGILNMPSTYEICVAAQDQIRLIGYDKCTDDLDSVYTVNAVDTDAQTITLDQFQVDSDETFSASLSTDIVPLGCTQTSQVSSCIPRFIEHVAAEDLILTGGATARADYHNSMGVTFAAGDEWAVTTVNNIVLPGDTLTASDVGLTTPVKVLETREVETNKGTVTYLRLESAPTSSGCYTAIVRRGVLFPFYATYDATTGCIDVYIPGGSTSQIQLHQSWLRAGFKDQYVVGRYTIMGHWGEIHPTTGNMIPRSKLLLGGDLILQASHLFNTAA